MPFRRDVLLLLGFSLTFVQACAFKKDEPIKEKLVYAQKLDLNDPSLSKSFAEKVHSEIVKKVFVKGELTPEAEEMYLRSQPPEVTADWLSGIKSPGVRQIWKIKDTAAGLQANVLRPSLLVFEPENKPSLRLSFIKETGAYELTLPLLLWDGRSGLAHFSGNPVRDDGEQVFVRQDLDAHFKISGIPHRVFTGCVRELLIKDSSGSTLSSANLVGSEGCSGHGVLYPKFRFTSQTLELFRRKMLMGEELKLVSRSYVDSLVRRGTYEVAIDTQSLMRSVRSRLSAQGLELKDKEVSQEIKNILLEEFSAIKALQRSDYKIHIDLITESLTNRLAMSFCGNSCAKKIFDPSTKIEPQQIVSWSAGIIRPTDRLLEASHDLSNLFHVIHIDQDKGLIFNEVPGFNVRSRFPIDLKFGDYLYLPSPQVLHYLQDTEKWSVVEQTKHDGPCHYVWKGVNPAHYECPPSNYRRRYSFPHFSWVEMQGVSKIEKFYLHTSLNDNFRCYVPTAALDGSFIIDLGGIMNCFGANALHSNLTISADISATQLQKIGVSDFGAYHPGNPPGADDPSAMVKSEIRSVPVKIRSYIKVFRLWEVVN